MIRRLSSNHRLAAVIALVVIVSASPVSAGEPRWTRVLSGEPVAGPIAIGSRVVTVSDDRSITCIDRDGSFIWSGRLPGKPLPFLAVLDDSRILAVSEPDMLSLYGAEGNALWRVRGTGIPVGSPKNGRDGRFFVPYKDAVRCFAINGLMLWSVSLPGSYNGLIGETGAGDILVYCDGDRLARITPFGETREIITHTQDSEETKKESLAALAPLPYGFAAGYESGYIVAQDVRDGLSGRKSSTVWSMRLANPIRALYETSGTLFVILSDGTAIAMNATDGSPLWATATGLTFTVGTRITRDYGQFDVVSPISACSISDTGTVLWTLEMPGRENAATLAADGSVYAAGTGWSISAWTAERRIRNDGSSRAEESYGILANSRILDPWVAHPDTEEVAAFFQRVAAALSAGVGKTGAGTEYVGADEAEWAQRLAAIVSNRSFGTLALPGIREVFFDTERARAASLLGQLGSSEYRDFLVAESSRNPGETLSLGLLYGLAASGGDRYGATAAAINTIAREAGTANDTVNRAVCDALYALIRYSSGEEASAYAKALAAYTRPPFGESVREYARQVLVNIVQ